MRVKFDPSGGKITVKEVVIMKDDGGPAFPRPSCEQGFVEEGMSLRDWFAGHALAGLSAKHGTVLGDDGEWIAMQAYAYADAMIEERSKIAKEALGDD